ncbi:MAG: phage major capsid protein [Pseudomonadota bacterium]|nr:phage major capsid protein [Pseudomonadota bacterium]
MTLAQLKAKLGELKAEASAILDRMEAAGGFGAAAAAEHETAYNAKKAEIEAAASKVAAAERLAEERREMGASPSRPALSIGTVNEPNPETTGGFKSLAEFAVAVRGAVVNNEADRRLAAPSNPHSADGSSGEGYLIPEQYRDAIWEAVTAEDDALSRFTLEPTSARSIPYTKDETTPWGATGIQAKWRSEGGQMTPTKAGVKGGRLELHQLYAFAEAEDELLADAPRLANLLTKKAGQAIGWKSMEAIMWADGVGKPMGFMNSSALVTVAKESGQAAASIVADNVNKMFARQHMPGRSGWFWLANIDVFPQLQKLNAGTDAPLFYPPGGIAAAPNGMLLGKPIVYTEHSETLGTVGDLALVNPEGYFGAKRTAGVEFATSIHLWFDYATTAFRWTFRMGGAPFLSEPVSPAKGSGTRSHFIALATRA